MGAFVDVYLPPAVPGYPCLSGPMFSTTITVASGGDEGRNKNWRHPLRRLKLPKADARLWDVISGLNDLALVLGGPYASFAFRDPIDFASVKLEQPNEPQAFVLSRVTPADQAFGTGDGVTRTFQLTKTYTVGPASYVRPIGLPILSTLKIAEDGTPTTAFSCSRPSGVVTFDSAPADGAALTWGGLFDIPVRFADDTPLDNVVQAYMAAGFAEIELQETRIC